MNIKERILQVFEDQDETKKKFFSTLGYSYSNFRSGVMDTQVGSDVLIKLVEHYNVSPRWILTGKGNRYDDDHSIAAEPSPEYSAEKSDMIELMKKSLADKEKIIEMLEKENIRLQTPLQKKKGAG